MLALMLQMRLFELEPCCRPVCFAELIYTCIFHFFFFWSLKEQVLLDRDRVVSKTWYNEDKDRWEMDPMAVPYAVSRKLIDSARIRHDYAVMYVALKGDDKEYYMDIKVDQLQS